MDVYSELLSELGIVHDIPCDENKLRIIQTQEEIEYSWQCEQSVSCPMSNGFGLDYKDEQSYDWRKKHRYFRKGRFKSTLYNLLNLRGNIPTAVIELVRVELKLIRCSKSKIWNQVRSVLKRNKLTDYYNLIPGIIKHVTDLRIIVDPDALDRTLADFDLMHDQFDNLAEVWGRKYFPNLRFTALTLLRKNGVVYPYNVPLLRTARKQAYLNLFMAEFTLNVDAKEISGSDGEDQESGEENLGTRASKL